MNRLLLLISSIFIFATTVNAQRHIDVEATRFNGPDEVQSTQNGTYYDIDFVVTNNGSDTAISGDTIFYRYQTSIGTTTFYIQGLEPDKSPKWDEYVLSSNLNPGDSIVFKGTYRVGAYITGNTYADMIGYVRISNGSDISDSITSNDSAYKQVWWKGLASIEETDNALIGKVYPQPATGYLNIELDGLTGGQISIELYSILGEKVLVESLVTMPSSVVRLDCRHLEMGTYILRVSKENVTTSQRIVIQ